MTDNPETDKKTTSERTFSLEAFGENVAQWMNQVGIGADADLQTTTLSEPLNGIEQAQVRLDLTVGRAVLEALPPESDNLIEVDVTSIGPVEMVTATENGTKSVRLRQKRSIDTADIFKPVKDVVDTVAHNTELQWVVRLSQRITIALTIHAGLTQDTFDLTGLTLPHFKLDGGAGKTEVTLAAGTTVADVDGGVGFLTLSVPAAAKLNLNLKIGAGATRIYTTATALNANIEGGVGNCEVFIPAEAGLRVRGESGLGNIDVPGRAQAVNFETEFISESGTWQTEGYQFADQTVDIRYEGGVGSLIIREQ